jgi:hypothetical protein
MTIQTKIVPGWRGTFSPKPIRRHLKSLSDLTMMHGGEHGFVPVHEGIALAHRDTVT